MIGIKFFNRFNNSSLIIPGLIILGSLLSCEKEEVTDKVDYADYSSYVGAEGRTIHFYENNSNIPDSLFPVLIIQANTFDTNTGINLSYKKVVNNLTLIANGLTSISDENYAWYFSSAETTINKPIELIIPFSDPSDNLLLDNYKYLFKLYKIRNEDDTLYSNEWEIVENFSLDTSNNLISTFINNFDYGYCVLFEEIKRDDNYIINISGDFEAIHRGSVNLITLNLELQALIDSSFYKIFGLDIDDALFGFHYNEGISKILIMGVDLGISYFLYFELTGNSPGTYKNEDIDLKYINTDYGMAIMDNDKEVTIVVDNYGEIGEVVEGTIDGYLIEDESLSLMDWETIDIHVSFRFIRTR